MNSKLSIKRSSVMAVLACAMALQVDVVSASSQMLQQGLAAYGAGRYEDAFKLLKAGADKGHAKAQHLVGTMYRTGLGIEPNEYEAFMWCRRAAEEGLLEAQFQLGLMFLEGEGVTQDDEAAMRWLWEAADRGYPQASDVLQYLLMNDFGTGC